MTSPLGRHDGNWTELRRLVLRLLEEHEEEIADLKALVQGSSSNRGLRSRLSVVEEKVSQIEKIKNLIESETPEKMSIKDHIKEKGILVGVISALAAIITKLVDLVVNLFNASGGTPGN